MAKKAKAKAAAKKKSKRATKRGTRKVDRCRPLREHVARLQDDIEEVRGQLAEPDIPRDLRRKLEKLLAQLLTQLRQALALLRACEAIKDPR